jgi:transcriptional regulator with XRE-family HTH domain
MAALSQAIAFHRERNGLSLMAVSKGCKLNYEHLCEVARGQGNPTFETLMELCVGLGATIGELMTTLDDFRAGRAPDSRRPASSSPAAPAQ